MRPTNLSLLLCWIPISTLAQKVIIPANLGPHAVSIQEFQLNTTRNDTRAPTPRKRSLMLSVFKPTYPIFDCPRNVSIPYMPSPVDRILLDLIANQSGLPIPNTTFEALQLQTCPLNSSAPRASSRSCDPTLDDAPLLLFSPGSAISRLLYSAICQAVASSGYTVISIDHTWEAPAVQFPDGSIAYDQLTNAQFSTNRTVIDAYSRQQTDVRVFDALSVLDAVEQGRIPGVVHRSGRSPLRAGMFGHSMGGSTAVAVAMNTSRVVAAVNYDGSYLSYIPDRRLDKPVLALAHIPSPDLVASWDKLWNNTHAWKAQWAVNGSQHASFQDYPVDLATLGLDKAFGPELVPLIGTVQGNRILEIVWKYTTAFFDFTLKGQKPQEILVNQTSEFPELIKMRQANGRVYSSQSFQAQRAMQAGS